MSSQAHDQVARRALENEITELMSFVNTEQHSGSTWPNFWLRAASYARVRGMLRTQRILRNLSYRSISSFTENALNAIRKFVLLSDYPKFEVAVRQLAINTEALDRRALTVFFNLQDFEKVEEFFDSVPQVVPIMVVITEGTEVEEPRAPPRSLPPWFEPGYGPDGGGRDWAT